MTDRFDEMADAIVKRELEAYFVSPRPVSARISAEPFDLRDAIANALRSVSMDAVRSDVATDISPLVWVNGKRCAPKGSILDDGGVVRKRHPMDGERDRDGNLPFVVYKDGTQWCVTRLNFQNLQESSAGFGGSIGEAMCELKLAEHTAEAAAQPLVERLTWVPKEGVDDGK